MKFQGLTSDEVVKLWRVHGSNSLPEEKPYGVLSILLSQLKSPLIYILLGVIVVSLFFKEYLDTILIFSVVTLNVLMGFFQEFSAQKNPSCS